MTSGTRTTDHLREEALLLAMERVLITGGAGFIGSHFVDRLIANGVSEVVVLDNLNRGRLENLKGSWERMRFMQGDIRDRRLLRELLPGKDVVFHLAAVSRVVEAEEDLDRTFAVNVQGTFNVLSAALEAGVHRVVFASSREVYGEPDYLPVPEKAPLKPKNGYGTSKASAELWCRLFRCRGLDVVILRLANVYGPRDYGRVIPTFLECARKGQPLVLYGGRQVLDFIWIETVVEVLIRAGTMKLLAGVDAVNVGSGKGVALTELADQVRSRVTHPVPIQVHPSRAVDVDRFVADIDQLQRLFGVIPEEDPLAHLGELVSEGTLLSPDEGSRLDVRQGGLPPPETEIARKARSW